MKNTTKLRLFSGFLLCLFTAFGLAQGPPIPRGDLLPAIAVQEMHTLDLMDRFPDVIGTGVSVSEAGEPIIRVYLKTPGARGLPGALDGIPLVPYVTGEIVARKGPPPNKGPQPEVDPTARFPRPVPIGVSTGHPDITAGTIGARVTDGVNVYALSNNHVYADENRASIGDSVLQPGAFDGGIDPDDMIGTLSDFEPIFFYPYGINFIDAAIALSSPDLLDNATPADGYGEPRSLTVSPAVGMRVKKYGRTTGQTKGRIDSINAILFVQYESGLALFYDQFVIIPGNFSAPGDSGSLIVVDRGEHSDKPVGLLFAGSMTATIANPIDFVLGTFGVWVDGPAVK